MHDLEDAMVLFLVILKVSWNFTRSRNCLALNDDLWSLSNLCILYESYRLILSSLDIYNVKFNEDDPQSNETCDIRRQKTIRLH